MVLGQTVALTAERVVAPIEGMHRVIARRWFNVTGVLGRPARKVHDAISNGVYGSVRLGAAALGEVINTRVHADSPISSRSRAIVNGLWGDDLGRFGDDLEIDMEISDACGVVADGTGVRTIPREAAGHIVVLVHGLFETPDCWTAEVGERSLVETLEGRSHLTVLRVRYNSGLRISDNSERLAWMLSLICTSWPVPVETIALIGSSMGGLLIQSACAAARAQDQAWVGKVSDVVTLATPYRGTPIEQGVALASSALSMAESTRPLAQFLDSRSAGIKDLRHGSTTADRGLSAPNSRHRFVAAVVTSDPASPIGSALGDLVVWPRSALPRGREPATCAVVIGGTNHFGVIGNPDVIDRVVEWIDPSP
jgi:pimeloyl-ACP methyl ester carboxylesterase